jgi:Zn-dependent peptidase ImmA (M78 family)
MATVSVNPELLRWAIDRAGLQVEDLLNKYPNLPDWLEGTKKPTFRQLEGFSKKTRAPFGYLLLEKPPQEKELKLPDYRTPADTPIDKPSLNLLETIQAMELRQGWMRDYLIEEGEEKLSFIGSAKNIRSVRHLANTIRETLGLESDWLEKNNRRDDTLKIFIAAIEKMGVLVFKNSVVENKTIRSLDPQEFRGFVLCDDYAPLIFVNTVDTMSAQLFTLAHELVHLWLGEDGIFNLIGMMPSRNRTEKFCNRVAAEFLVPATKLRRNWKDNLVAKAQISSIARSFKVSPIVIARRALDLGLISGAEFIVFYKKDREEWDEIKKNRSDSGGPPYAVVQKSRLSNRFSTAVAQAVKEGKLLYRDAYRFTGFKGNSFDDFSKGLLQG